VGKEYEYLLTKKRHSYMKEGERRRNSSPAQACWGGGKVRSSLNLELQEEGETSKEKSIVEGKQKRGLGGGREFEPLTSLTKVKSQGDELNEGGGVGLVGVVVVGVGFFLLGTGSYVFLGWGFGAVGVFYLWKRGMISSSLRDWPWGKYRVQMEVKKEKQRSLVLNCLGSRGEN